MKILLVAATSLETKALRNHFDLTDSISNGIGIPFAAGKHACTLLHTGVGMSNTSFWLGKHLATHPYDQAIQFGISGSFDRDIELGAVVEVQSDVFAELGADSPEGFIDMEKMGFPVLQTQNRSYFNCFPNPTPSASGLPPVRGITMNRVSGTEPEISHIRTRWNAQVESMESAAFFHAMLAMDIPFSAFRGVSNYVEPRDRSKWKLGLASENVQSFVVSLLQNI